MLVKKSHLEHLKELRAGFSLDIGDQRVAFLVALIEKVLQMKIFLHCLVKKLINLVDVTF